MRKSDAENGEQESGERSEAEDSSRPAPAPAGGRRVPTPADVFRRKRPAAEPQADSDEEAG